ncbi:MAG TPA: hypothetical protein DIW07_14380, partial [Lachnospiraceae bacterium]|nr:hypothetical protein [Lachnospiraceae bacterium]
RKGGLHREVAEKQANSKPLDKSVESLLSVKHYNMKVAVKCNENISLLLFLSLRDIIKLLSKEEVLE